jgi:uncharacterized membrane protein YiaA
VGTFQRVVTTCAGALIVLAAAFHTCPRPALAAVGLVLMGVVNLAEIRHYLWRRGGDDETGT